MKRLKQKVLSIKYGVNMVRYLILCTQYFILAFITVACFGQAPNTWVQKNDVGWNSANGPTPRQGAAGFSIGTKGYIGMGFNSGGIYCNDFWEWDQSTNIWTQKANFGGMGRADAVGFSIGTKGYIGTGSDSTSSRNDFWEWDQSTNTWTQKADFGGTARAGAIGFVIGTKGYIGTGNDGNYKNDFWEWNQGTNTWTQKANFGGAGVGYAVGFSIGTKGYIGTGYDGTYRNDFWEWDQSSNTWTQKASYSGIGRESATGFAIGSKGYIGTGFNSGICYNDFYEWDQSSNTWTQKATFSGTARSGATGFSIGTKGYIGTGGGNFQPNDFWEWNQSTNTWMQKAPFGGPVRAEATGFVINTKGYIGTGDQGAFGSLNDFWEWDQVTNTWTQKANFGGVARFRAVGFAIGTKGYIGTGEYEGTPYVIYLKDFWEWDQTTNIWTQKANFAGGLRSEAVGFSIGNKGYIGTGIDSAGNNKNDFWEWNQASNTWTQKANFGGTARVGATGFSIGTKGYIGTGYDGSYKNDFWEWNQGTNTWMQKANFGGVATDLAAGFSIGTKGYISSSNPYGDFWEWDQATNIWTRKADFAGSARRSAVGFAIGSKGYIGTGFESSGNGNNNSDFWEYTPSGLATVAIGTISASSLCAGSGISVPYTAYNTFNAGNVFTAQLSNAAGSFVSAVNIGSVTSTSSGTISAVIPAITVPGNGYRIRVISSNPVVIAPDNGSNDTITHGDTLNLKFFSQGYYINGGTLKKVLHNEAVDTNAASTNVDTVVVELHNSTSPYGVVESYKGVLQTNGTIVCYFSCNVTGHTYYIAVKHRNTNQTWSAAPVAFTASTSYDFTTAATKAYGSNMKQMEPGKWAFYTGDINQDENIDLQDFPALDYGIVNGLFGYYASDLNGDGNVDLVDFPILNANIVLGIFSQHP